MKKHLLFVLVFCLFSSIFNHAVAASPEGESEVVVEAPKTEIVELPRVSWRIPNNKYAIGAMANAFGTAQLCFDNWVNQDWGYSYSVLYTKGGDSYYETQTTAATGVGPVTVTETTSYSGSRTLPKYGIAASIKRKFHESNFFRSYYGMGFGLTMHDSVRYKVGTRSRSYNASTPNVVTVNETGLGVTTISAQPIGSVALMMGAHFPLKWLPHLLLGFEGALNYTAPQLGKTKTHTVTQTYTETDGVAGAPSSHSESDSTIASDEGGHGSTTLGNGSIFNVFTGSFSLLYTW